MPVKRDEYGEYMDALTERIIEVVDGEEMHDAILACAAVIAFALKSMPRDKQVETLGTAMKFMASILGRDRVDA